MTEITLASEGVLQSLVPYGMLMHQDRDRYRRWETLVRDALSHGIYRWRVQLLPFTNQTAPHPHYLYGVTICFRAGDVVWEQTITGEFLDDMPDPTRHVRDLERLSAYHLQHDFGVDVVAVECASPALLAGMSQVLGSNFDESDIPAYQMLERQIISYLTIEPYRWKVHLRPWMDRQRYKVGVSVTIVCESGQSSMSIGIEVLTSSQHTKNVISELERHSEERFTEWGIPVRVG